MRGKGPAARTVYLDAATGAERLSLPLAKDQGAVGEEPGRLNDRKKVATRLVGGTYYTEDMLRPPLLWTIDLRTIAAGSTTSPTAAAGVSRTWRQCQRVDRSGRGRPPRLDL
ncbi:MAG: hypothetical protein R2708_28985 [Vicinamibacterales bacterium]